MKKIVKTVGLISAEIATVKKMRKPHSYDGFIGSGGKLAVGVKGMDVKYNPINEDLTLENINIVLDKITTDNENVSILVTPNKEALLARNDSYDEMPERVLGALNVFRSSKDVTPAKILISENLAKKVFGTRIIPIKKTSAPSTDATDATTEESELDIIKRNSVSHQQFESRSGNYFKFTAYTCNDVCYKTNDLRYKPEAMKAYYETLKPINDTAEETSNAITSARDVRIDSYFDNTKGARFIFNQVKKYVASTYGTKSAEYKIVKGLPFPNLIAKTKRKPSASN